MYVAECFVKKSRNGDYGVCVMAIDWSTGAIVQVLKECGVYENTLIIFTSDNGSRNDFGESNGILRGCKGEIWEGGQRVPLIVHWKGKIKPSVCKELVTSMDLYPSLVKLVGEEIPADKKIDGMDLSKLLLGETEHSDRNTFFYYMYHNLEAIRVGNWKLHLCRPQVGTDGENPRPVYDNDVEVKELYDLSTDPSEQKNVYEENPELVRRIMEEVEICRNDLGDTFTKTVGAGVRPIGKVDDPKPLTCYEEDYPYIIPMYDKVEAG